VQVGRRVNEESSSVWSHDEKTAWHTSNHDAFLTPTLQAPGAIRALPPRPHSAMSGVMGGGDGAG